MPARSARLIYHPRRDHRRFGDTAVYFDSTTGNQDPYVWNDPFLHSYCHITQFHAEPGDINLWVSGDASRSSAACTATWYSWWPGNASGPRLTSSAAATCS